MNYSELFHFFLYKFSLYSIFDNFNKLFHAENYNNFLKNSKWLLRIYKRNKTEKYGYQFVVVIEVVGLSLTGKMLDKCLIRTVKCIWATQVQ
jgi:hypothetical protein